MSILDRYLLRQFLHTFVICFFSLTGLYIVIHGFSNLDDFIATADKHRGLMSVVGEFYAYRTLAFFDQTSGILTLIAAMFTVTAFQRYNELTALEAAGISKGKVLRPVILAVVVISLIAAANREFVLPRIRTELSQTPQDLGGKKAQRLDLCTDQDTDILLDGKQTLAEDQSIIHPNFIMPASLSQYSRHLVAEKAYYRPPVKDLPGGYLFDKLEQPKSLDNVHSLEHDGRRVLLTPLDTTWLKSGQCFVVSGVSFEQLKGGNSWQLYSSVVELIAGLRNRSLDFGSEVRVEIHSRFVKPLLDVTLLCLGLPLVLSRKNRNMFLAIGLSIVLVGWFMGFVLICQYFGKHYNHLVSPALAAWLPLLVFVPWAAGTADPLLE